MSQSGDPPDRPPAGRGDHEPDYEAIAAMVDGSLGWWSRRRVVRHLAGCGQCRDLWLALADAAADGPLKDTARPAPGWFPTRWPAVVGGAALACLLVVVVTSMLPQRQADPEQWFGNAPDLPVSAQWSSAADPVYRAVGDPLPAVGLSPRWSATATRSPAFQWHPAGGLDAERAEILVVDGNEALVAVWHVDAGAGQASWPESAPTLHDGREYAWKLTVWTAGGPQTTSFVPFYVATDLPAAVSGSPGDRLGGLIEAGQFDHAFLMLLKTPDLLSPQAYRSVMDELRRRLGFTQAEQELLGIQE